MEVFTEQFGHTAQYFGKSRITPVMKIPFKTDDLLTNSLGWARTGPAEVSFFLHLVKKIQEDVWPVGGNLSENAQPLMFKFDWHCTHFQVFISISGYFQISNFLRRNCQRGESISLAFWVVFMQFWEFRHIQPLEQLFSKNSFPKRTTLSIVFKFRAAVKSPRR